MRNKISLSTLLYQDIQGAEVFLDDRRQAHIVLRADDGSDPRHLPLRGGELLNHLRRRAFALTSEVPSDTPLRAVINLLEAQARHAPPVNLWNRVARDGDGAIWLDLGDPQRRAVRVTAAGWEVRPAPRLFRRYAHQLALPVPERGGELAGLCRLLNLRSPADQLLYLVSLVVTLVPDIPQPLLILHGPQGAAKTTAARLRRALVDPSSFPTVMVRAELGELAQALDHHYMPVFDNLVGLSAQQEQVLCQTATGGAFTKRRLFTDEEDVIMTLRRPVVLTGISLPSVSPDLLDRSLLIGLEPIAKEGRRDETSLWAEFAREQPRLLGGLLDALSGAMERQAGLEFTGLLRMADFTRWGTAAALSLGYEGDDFLEALSGNVQRQSEEVLDSDPLAQAVRALVARDGMVVGSAARLLELLLGCAGPAGLPRRPAELSRRLNVLRAPLTELGIMVKSARSTGHDRLRTWVLAEQREEPGSR